MPGKLILLCSFSLIVLMACGTAKESNPEPFRYEYIDNGQQGESTVKGKIVDESGEPLVGAKVVLYQEGESMITGAVTDLEGEFYITTTFQGQTYIRVEYLGMVSKNLPERFTLNLIHGKTIIFNDTLQMQEDQIELLKPMIYLYSKDTLEVTVQVETPGQLVNCYPAYDKAWKIIACPDGNLIDDKGRNYYGLYWESNLSNIFSITNGTVIAREDNIDFLEKSLKKLGLNDHEANEFIVYWLPVLNQSPFNMIHFSTSAYDQKIPLHVSPQPDQLIRIMMFYKPLKEKIDFPSQEIEVTERSADGFTVVEWGGSKMLEESDVQ